MSPYNFSWDGPGSFQANSEDINNVIVGTYSLHVIDDNGCVLNTNITLSEPPILSSTLSSDADYNGYDISCFGAFDGGVSSVINGGLSPYNLLWSNGLTTSSISDLPAGQYGLTVTDLNGCPLSDSIVLIEPSQLSSSIQSINNYNGFDISCLNASDGAIGLSVNGSVPPYSYVWNNSATSQNVVNVPAGQYSVTITDDNGCADSQQLILSEPSGFSSSVSTSDYNGYDISCYDAEDGWIDFTIGGSVSPYNFNWDGPGSFQANSEDISLLSGGIYTLYIVDDNGCIHSDIVNLSEPEGMYALINTTPDTCYKGVGSAEMIDHGGGVPPIFVNWGDNINSLSASDLYMGEKTVSLVDRNSCELELTYSIDNLEHPIADFHSADYEYDIFDQLETAIEFYDASYDEWSQIINWYWDLGDETNYQTQNITHSYDTIGDFLVRLIIENEHQCTDTIEKRLSIKGYKLFIPNTFTPNNDNNNDVFKPIGFGVDFFEMKIYDRWGKEIFHGNDLQRGWDGKHQNQAVQIGVYTYKIKAIDFFGNHYFYTGEIHLLR